MVELEKIEEAARWQENYDKQLKDIKKLQKACHKWFMRWREAKKDALYFDSSLQKQIEATLKLQQENAELKEKLKTAYRKGMRHMAKALKDYDRTDGAWTDYFEHTVNKVLHREQLDFEKYGTLADQLTKAKEIIKTFLKYDDRTEFLDYEYEEYRKNKEQAEQFLNSEEK